MARASSLLIDVVFVDSLECPIPTYGSFEQELMDQIGFRGSGESEWPWQVECTSLLTCYVAKSCLDRSSSGRQIGGDGSSASLDLGGARGRLVRDGELAELNRAGHSKERFNEILKTIDGRPLCNYSIHPTSFAPPCCVCFLPGFSFLRLFSQLLAGQTS